MLVGDGIGGDAAWAGLARVLLKAFGCPCAGLPEIIRVGQHRFLIRSLSVLERGSWAWLCECAACRQLWSVDETVKEREPQYAVKIPAREGWRELDTDAAKKRLLLSSRGGTTGEMCVWAGCEGRRVRGVALCVDHLFASGVRG